MSRDSILARGRAVAEEGMVDTCLIQRGTGRVTDPTTGQVTETYETLHADQKCRVQMRGYWGQRMDHGEHAIVELTVEVQLPIAVDNLAVDDEITIVSSRHDPDLVGRRMAVKDLMSKTHATSRRVLCTEITG